MEWDQEPTDPIGEVLSMPHSEHMVNVPPCMPKASTTLGMHNCVDHFEAQGSAIINVRVYWVKGKN